MTGEHVAAEFLEPGDVIRVRHHHDAPSAECLTCWETDAVVTDDPVPVSGRTAIRWAGDARIHGGQSGITGISLFLPGELALRIGRLPVRSKLNPLTRWSGADAGGHILLSVSVMPSPAGCRAGGGKDRRPVSPSGTGCNSRGPSCTVPARSAPPSDGAPD
jgi:hypothetical protein